MSLQIRTTVSGSHKFLDLYTDEPILLSLSFAELQDITKKNSTFSKAFSVPGSKNNNEIFNFFYDLNSVPLDFNPNNKFDSILLWDGYEILQGHIRLNGVSIAKDEIIYQVTFYNQVGDLAANIGDKYLFNTILSGLSHPYSDNVILESILDPSLFNLTGSTNYSYQNGQTFWGLYNIGYDYISGTTLNDDISPLIQFSPLLSANTGPIYYPTSGNFDFSGTPVRDFYFKPTIQVKALYEKICLDAGYEIESDFFSTDYFKKFYLPLKFLDETIFSRNSIQSCYKYGPQSFNLTSILNTEYTVPNSGVTCNSLGFSATTTGITIPDEFQQTYTFRFTFNLSGTCDFNLFQIPTIFLGVDDQTTQTVFYQNQFCSDDVQVVSLEQTFIFTGTSTFGFYFQGEFVNVSGFTAEIINGPRFIPSGKTIDYREEFPDNDYTQIDFITSVNKYFNLIMVPNPDKPNSLIVEPIIDYIGKGRVLDWTTKIDGSQLQSVYPTTSLLNGTLEYEFKLDQDYANQDFKTRANRIFGTDKFKLNLEYKDTITKFDYQFSSPIDITINNAFIPLLTVESMSKLKSIDRDGQSQQTFVPFKILPKLIFRGPTIPTDNYGFVGGTGTTTGSSTCKSGITFNLTTTFSPTTIFYTDCFGIQKSMNAYSGSNTVPECADPSSVSVPLIYLPLPTLSITSSGTTCGTVVQTPIYQTWYVDGYSQDRFVNLNRFTTYPFAYNDFSHYCNFRGEDRTNIQPEEFAFDSEDLYDIYYKPYVDDLISAENKIYSAKIYLYPQEIQQIRWNEKILINNTYFRINRITNFNMTEPSICDIELVKLTKEYPGHRVLYYDLVPCSTGDTELHSSSDYNYHLYLYVGNFVKIYDDSLNYLGCYNVQIGTYNSGYTYNHYFIESGYTSNLVSVYPDCSCTGRTAFNLVQEEPGEPRYFVYSGTECNGSSGYVFSSTGSSLDTTGLVYSIYNPQIFVQECVSGITPYFITTTDWIVVSGHSNCDDCDCVVCYSYTFGPAESNGLVEWLDCDGILSDAYVGEGEFYSIPCARQGTVYGDGPITEGSICFNGCITPTPTPTSVTPTPTPTSVTPTPTPTNTTTLTPTPSSSPVPECLCYSILNETGGSLNYTYYNCETGEITNSLGGGQNIQVCSSQVPFGDAGITVITCTSVTDCNTNTDCTGCS